MELCRRLSLLLCDVALAHLICHSSVGFIYIILEWRFDLLLRRIQITYAEQGREKSNVGEVKMSLAKRRLIDSRNVQKKAAEAAAVG